jgi:formylglycine-generating enzyme required for sulfatase activity
MRDKNMKTGLKLRDSRSFSKLVMALALLGVLTCFLHFAFAAGGKKVAVLELVNKAGVTDDEAYFLTDKVRRTASQMLPISDFTIMTSENIEELLPPDMDLKKCTDAKCEVEMGRMIGAEYLITGEILRYAGKLRVQVKVHHVPSGHFIGSEDTKAGKLEKQESMLSAVSTVLMNKVLVHSGVAAPAPTPVYKPTPAPYVPSAGADPAFEELVKKEQARIEAEGRLAADNKAQLDADYGALKSLHDSAYSKEAKKAGYQKFIEKWPDDKTYMPGVKRWLAMGDVPEEFVLVKAGRFQMGSPKNEKGRSKDETQHSVTISKAFLLGTTEVTQGQWKAVMGSNPSKFSSGGDNCPVEQVSWNEAVDFCNRLSDKESLSRCYSGGGDNISWDRSCTGYRLPSEAEWEYAARAGTTTRFACGDSDSCLDSMGWYLENSGNSTRSVATKRANSWGLYDMHGNIWEWTWDWYNKKYPSASVTDPVGPSSGSGRVIRGGGSYDLAGACRSAIRGSIDPGDRYLFLGFRLARSLP